MKKSNSNHVPLGQEIKQKLKLLKLNFLENSWNFLLLDERLDIILCSYSLSQWSPSLLPPAFIHSQLLLQISKKLKHCNHHKPDTLIGRKKTHICAVSHRCVKTMKKYFSWNNLPCCTCLLTLETPPPILGTYWFKVLFSLFLTAIFFSTYRVFGWRAATYL